MAQAIVPRRQRDRNRITGRTVQSVAGRITAQAGPAGSRRRNDGGPPRLSPMLSDMPAAGKSF